MQRLLRRLPRPHRSFTRSRPAEGVQVERALAWINVDNPQSYFERVRGEVGPSGSRSATGRLICPAFIGFERRGFRTLR